ncbi:MAG: hypothetical protein ACRC7O_03915, partial [Fimbriiglobus sp.]
FYNRSGRDVRITVSGEAMPLPANSYVTARVSGVFRWTLDGGSLESAEVPAGAAGLDVVIRR